jgi:hypothetical protein
MGSYYANERGAGILVAPFRIPQSLLYS